MPRMPEWMLVDTGLAVEGMHRLGKQEEETQPQSLHIVKRGTETESKQRRAKDPVSSGTGDSSVGPCGHLTPRQTPT